MVEEADALEFLSRYSDESVNAIITSPPYPGLPGRAADSLAVIQKVIRAAGRILKGDGALVLVVGSSDYAVKFPFLVACSDGLPLHSWHAWKRSVRKGKSQDHNHDLILVFSDRDEPFTRYQSRFESTVPGFDYGSGVSLPRGIAGELVFTYSTPGDLVIDPFCGFGEIGVQAKLLGRLFEGCDLDPACVEITRRRLDALGV